MDETSSTGQNWNIAATVPHHGGLSVVILISLKISIVLGIRHHPRSVPAPHTSELLSSEMRTETDICPVSWVRPDWCLVYYESHNDTSGLLSKGQLTPKFNLLPMHSTLLYVRTHFETEYLVEYVKIMAKQ